jgi:hypothetical protein
MERKESSYQITVIDRPGTVQYVITKADSIILEGECICLKLNGDTIGIYPSRYTIIEKI